MGHAVYKTMDPRARFLKDMAFRIGNKTGQSRWHELSTQIETAGLEEFKKRGKPEIQPNVDFFSAPVYHMMGISRDLMTPIFAISRTQGGAATLLRRNSLKLRKSLLFTDRRPSMWASTAGSWGASMLLRKRESDSPQSGAESAICISSLRVLRSLLGKSPSRPPL